MLSAELEDPVLLLSTQHSVLMTWNASSIPLWRGLFALQLALSRSGRPVVVIPERLVGCNPRTNQALDAGGLHPPYFAAFRLVMADPLGDFPLARAPSPGGDTKSVTFYCQEVELCDLARLGRRFGAGSGAGGSGGAAGAFLGLGGLGALGAAAAGFGSSASRRAVSAATWAVSAAT